MRTNFYKLRYNFLTWNYLTHLSTHKYISSFFLSRQVSQTKNDMPNKPDTANGNPVWRGSAVVLNRASCEANYWASAMDCWVPQHLQATRKWKLVCHEKSSKILFLSFPLISPNSINSINSTRTSQKNVGKKLLVAIAKFFSVLNRWSFDHIYWLHQYMYVLYSWITFGFATQSPNFFFTGKLFTSSLNSLSDSIRFLDIISYYSSHMRWKTVLNYFSRSKIFAKY